MSDDIFDTILDLQSISSKIKDLESYKYSIEYSKDKYITKIQELEERAKSENERIIHDIYYEAKRIPEIPDLSKINSINNTKYYSAYDGITYSNFAKWLHIQQFTKSDETKFESFIKHGESVRSKIKKYTMNCSETTGEYHSEIAQLEAEINKLDCEYNKYAAEKLAECDRLDTGLHSNYYYLADTIADLLQTGRADTVKEALNYAIAEERSIAQHNEELKAIEEQNQILAEQVEEEARHNRMLEEQEQKRAMAEKEHNREMEAAAERNNRLLKEQADAARDAERDKRDREKKFLDAKIEFEKWQRHYESAAKGGRTADAITYKGFMERAEAEMLQYKQ